MNATQVKRLARAEHSLLSAEAARYAPPMDPVDLFTAVVGSPPDPWQDDMLLSGARRVLLMASRQSGKSSVASVLALHQAAYTPGSLVLCVSPSLRQSAELYRKVAVGLGSLGQAVPVEAQSALRMELRNGSRVISLPGSEATVKGYSAPALVLVDEAARVDDMLVEGALRPMFAVNPSGRLVMMSTPWGRRGVFYQNWVDGGDDWTRIKVTAEDVPRITPAFLEAEKRALPPSVYQSEYLCQFVDNELSVFASADIEAALDPTIEPLFWE